MATGFWSGRRVFLTGHTGFKGSWLSLWLERLGAEVTGYALAPATEPSLFAAAEVERGVRSVIADIRDVDALEGALADAAPELVVHMAAQALVRPSYAEPAETFDVNVMGTVRLLDAIRRVPSVRAVIVVTSDKCYENREWVWGYREADPMGGHDPYSASKGAAELAVAAYRRSFFGDGPLIASVRAGNVIGGGDWSVDRLVPDAARAFSKGQPVVLRNPGAVRPWQHVLDPLSGYLRLGELLLGDRRDFADAWNFGPAGDGTSTVGDVIAALAAHWGGGATWEVEGQADQPHEAHTLRLDVSKAQSELGWRGRLPLATALDWTAGWYRDFYAGAPARDLIAADIDRFEALSP